MAPSARDRAPALQILAAETRQGEQHAGAKPVQGVDLMGTEAELFEGQVAEASFGPTSMQCGGAGMTESGKHERIAEHCRPPDVDDAEGSCSPFAPRPLVAPGRSARGDIL